MPYSSDVIRSGQQVDRASLSGHRNEPPAADPVRRFRTAATQLTLIGVAALAYFGVRGLTEGSESTAIANAGRVLNLEAALGFDVEASLQGFILDHRGIVTAANWVYIWGHWPVIGMTLIWLYRQHRDSYTLLRNAMFISGAIGLAIFISFPVAPPRLMPTGFVDTVTDLSNSYRVLQPPSLINKYAAVPSLHVGWNLLVGILIFRTSRSRAARLFALAGPAFMTSAVILTANHYIVDAVAGSVVALIGLAGAVALQRAPAPCGRLPLPGMVGRRGLPLPTPPVTAQLTARSALAGLLSGSSSSDTNPARSTRSMQR